MRCECGGGVQFYNDARLFDEIAMAQEVRPYDGEPICREEGDEIKNLVCCERLHAICP